MVDVVNINEVLAGKIDKKILNYYSEVLLNSQKKAFDLGADVFGLSGEITLARSQIRSILEQEPHSYKINVLSLLWNAWSTPGTTSERTTHRDWWKEFVAFLLMLPFSNASPAPTLEIAKQLARFLFL